MFWSKKLRELERRVEALEKGSAEHASDAMVKAGKLFQDGINNILAYHWPLKKEDAE